MNESYPVPPPELVQQWQASLDCPDNSRAQAKYIATQAARWGYQQFAKEFAARGQREWREDEIY